MMTVEDEASTSEISRLMRLVAFIVSSGSAASASPATCPAQVLVQSDVPEKAIAAYSARDLRPLPEAAVSFLAQDRGAESPACLDGSPYGFYFVPSATGSTKWTLNINGGGWCYDEIDCYCRSKGDWGSSKGLPAYSGCDCMNPNANGSLWDTNCNCILMPYCDGASFSGYRADPWPVPEDQAAGVPAGATVTFRGIKNLDGVVDFAMKNGLGAATEFVFVGGSAGALAAFLHVDRIANRLKAEAPNITKIVAVPIVGYFLDRDNFRQTVGGKPNTPSWAQPGVGVSFASLMKYVCSMQNVTFGADGALMQKCQAKHPDQPHLCFMSPHVQDVIDTPFFMFNSKYDPWQLENILQVYAFQWTTEQKAVLQYGDDFMAQLAPVYISRETRHGGVITSCMCHDCPWKSLDLDGKNSLEHYADWFHGKTSGAASMHVDSRLPNGNGTLLGDEFSKCFPFQYQLPTVQKPAVSRPGEDLDTPTP